MNDDKKLNVLMTTSSFFRDKPDDIFGGGNFVFELAKGLSKNNNIFILAPKSDISKEKDSFFGITIYRFKQFLINKVDLAFGPGIIPNIRKNRFLIFVIPYFLLSQLLAIRQIVKKESITILHSNWLLPQGVVAALYKTLFNKKIELIITLHGSDLFGLNNSLFNRIKIFGLKKADKVTVVSNALKNRVNLLVPDKVVEVLPMGIDTDLFCIKVKDNDLLNTHGSKFKFVLFVGAVIEEKGIVELVQAMQIVIKTEKNVKLLVIGDGNLKESLNLFANDNNLNDNIDFLGFIPNNLVAEYFSIADLFILPSYSEGFGLVVAESLACGVKPVISNLECFKDFVNQETGVFLKDIRPETIAEAILNNINRNDYSKEDLRKGILENYSWEVISKRYHEIYFKLCN